MKKNVNIYQPAGSQIYYANYRTKVNDPVQGEVVVQRNISTGLTNKLAAQKWANNKRQQDVQNFDSGAGKTVNARQDGPLCGEVIDRFLERSQLTSKGKL